MATYKAMIATAGLTKGQLFSDDDAPANINGLLARGFVVVFDYGDSDEIESGWDFDDDPWVDGSDFALPDIWGTEEVAWQKGRDSKAYEGDD